MSMNIPAENPFNYNLPVSPDMFYGRQPDCDKLCQSLTANKGDSYALIGGRRMGKTSLLEAIHRNLALGSERFPVFPLPLMLDLTGKGIHSDGEFFRCVLEDVKTSLSECLGMQVDIPELGIGQPPAPFLTRQLPQWDRRVMNRHGRRLRFILLLDECEQVACQDWAADLYGALRSLLVGSATRSNLKVVMVGSHGFLNRIRQEGSPLRNILQYHTLRVLDPQDSRQLILQPINAKLAEPVTKMVIEQSGGHPFLIQYLMYQVWEQGLQAVTAQSVVKFASAFPHQRGDFQDWLSSIGTGGALVYRALLELGNPVTEDDLRRALHPFPADFLQALEALCYHGLVEAQDGRYQLAGQMFRSWFENNVTISVDATAEPKPAVDGATTIHVHGDWVGMKQVGTDQHGQTIVGQQANIENHSSRPSPASKAPPATPSEQSSEQSSTGALQDYFEHGYALLIGVDENKVASWALPAVSRDISALQAVLTHPERCAYRQEHVKVILGQDATRDNLLDALTWLKNSLAQDASEQTTALIYYSGHGWKDLSATPTGYYLIPYDVSPVSLRHSALRADDFASEVKDIHPRRLLVLLDCCHAGGMDMKDINSLVPFTLPPAWFMGGEKALALDDDAKALDSQLLMYGAGRAVLNSCQAHERSYMLPDEEMSLFTYFIIQALTGHAPHTTDDKHVSVAGLLDHVWRKVPPRAAQMGKQQHPDGQISGNFPIARLLGGQGIDPAKALPDPLDPLSIPDSTPTTSFDQRGQSVHGAQTNIAGQVSGTVLSGNFGSKVKLGHTPQPGSSEEK